MDNGIRCKGRGGGSILMPLRGRDEAGDEGERLVVFKCQGEFSATQLGAWGATVSST